MSISVTEADFRTHGVELDLSDTHAPWMSNPSAKEMSCVSCHVLKVVASGFQELEEFARCLAGAHTKIFWHAFPKHSRIILDLGIIPQWVLL